MPNGAYITNIYDNNGRTTTNCLFTSGGISLDCYQYTCNTNNQRASVARNNENYANYGYDSLSEVASDQAYEWSGTLRLNERLSYGYDPAGNLSRRTNNALVESFLVNTVNELTNNTSSGSLTVMGTATSSNTGVTINGTIIASNYNDATFAATNVPLTTSYTAVASDGYGRHSTNTVTVNLSTNVVFQYDGNGNLTNDGLRNFAYDDENELIQVWVATQWLSQFQYDGKMRRRIRKEFTWDSGLSSWRQTNQVYYVYDGNLVIQERDANNLPTVTYTRGIDLSGRFQGAGGIGGLLARTSQAYSDGPLAGQSFYHSDANGNVTMLIDSSQGVVAKYLYDAFGNMISASGLLANANVYRFSSKEWHQNAGLVYYLYRYYDPNLQRWVNRDPMEEQGGINLFTFVLNDPVDAKDLFGLAMGSSPIRLLPMQPPRSADPTVWQTFWEGVQDPNGYTACFARCMLGLGSATEVGTDFGGGVYAARWYYTTKYPTWFKAGGRCSKVLVPAFASSLSLGTALYSLFEAHHCYEKCSGNRVDIPSSPSWYSGGPVNAPVVLH